MGGGNCSDGCVVAVGRMSAHVTAWMRHCESPSGSCSVAIRGLVHRALTIGWQCAARIMRPTGGLAERPKQCLGGRAAPAARTPCCEPSPGLNSGHPSSNGGSSVVAVRVSQNESAPPSAKLCLAYRTKLGRAYQGTIDSFLQSKTWRYRGKVQLIFTSPPYPLNRKKKYGNKNGEEFVNWLADFAPRFRELLTPNGSIVIEMGNAWEPGHPVMSTLALRSLLTFLERGQLFLCQSFICDNPARLPGPAQWVNVERIRVKDSFTHVWWMSSVERPKADNRLVLREYSKSMKDLLRTGRYNAGRRPSEHTVGEKSFLTDNAGAIPSNVLTLANTASADPYMEFCKARGLPFHPARMPRGLAEFFIKFLTQEGDRVLDPFSGSNTTGAVAEELGRRWISVEPNAEYIQGSRGRFPSLRLQEAEMATSEPEEEDGND